MIALFLRSELPSTRFGEGLRALLESAEVPDQVITDPDLGDGTENRPRRFLASHGPVGLLLLADHLGGSNGAGGSGGIRTPEPSRVSRFQAVAAVGSWACPCSSGVRCGSGWTTSDNMGCRRGCRHSDHPPPAQDRPAGSKPASGMS